MVRLRRGRSKRPEHRRRAYEAISRSIIQGHVQVLFNASQPLDWTEGPNADRNLEEFCEFYETALHPAMEVDSLLAFTLELIEETRRHFPEMSSPHVPIVRPILELSQPLIDLAQHHPKLVCWRTMTPTPELDFSERLRRRVLSAGGFSKDNPDAMRERIDGWKDSAIATRNHFRDVGARGMTQEAKVEWANRAQFLDAVLSSSDPWIDQKELALILDFNRCRACSCFLNAFWRYAKGLSQAGPAHNDSDDWGQIPAIAYADYSLIERTLRNHVVAGTPSLDSRVFHEPESFAQAVGTNQ